VHHVVPDRVYSPLQRIAFEQSDAEAREVGARYRFYSHLVDPKGALAKRAGFSDQAGGFRRTRAPAGRLICAM
jgi:hypothetical protein